MNGTGNLKLVTATVEHLAAVLELLSGSGLPTSGVEDHLKTFVVALSDGAVKGVGGLEVYDRVGLLRSVAVAEDHRRRGVASEICARLEAEAARRGIDRLFLLTETAESFFARRGYETQELVITDSDQSRDVRLKPIANAVLFGKRFALDPQFGGEEKGAVGPTGMRASDVTT